VGGVRRRRRRVRRRRVNYCMVVLIFYVNYLCEGR
jgi:hypothetical protein